MPRGGARPGAGRPTGQRDRFAQQSIRRVVDEGTTPLDFMLSVLRDEKKPEAVRMDAAKAAAPYVHPRLANIEATHKGDPENPIVVSHVDAEL